MLRVLAPALAAAAALAYLAVELYLFGRLAFPLDDSWIHLHLARHLADGNGLSYDGERLVSGSTAPLWTALLALGFTISNAAGLAWAKALGIAGFVVTVAGADRLAGELGLGDGSRVLAACLVATSPWLVWSALSGMEVPLFTALTTWGLVWHLRERRRRDTSGRSLALLAAACLARPEGWVVFLGALADRVLRFDRPHGRRMVIDRGLWSRLGVGALISVPTLAVYTMIGGSPLPTTFAVKTGSGALSLWPNADYLRLVVDILLRSQPLATVLAAIGVVALLTRLGSSRDAGFLPALWLFGQPLAYAVLANRGGPLPLGNFGRYHFPLLVLTAVLAALAIDRLADRRRLFGVVAGLVLAAQLAVLAPGPLRYAQNIGNVEDTDVAAALWLAERLPPEAVVAAQDAGAVAFHLPEQRVLDLAGLVTPEVLGVLRGDDARYGGADIYWEERLARWLREQRPDVLVVFASSYPALTASPGFRRLETFTIDDNVTMAGHELVVVAPPWSRIRTP